MKDSLSAYGWTIIIVIILIILIAFAGPFAHWNAEAGQNLFAANRTQAESLMEQAASAFEEETVTEVNME